MASLRLSKLSHIAITILAVACAWAQPKIEIHSVTGTASERLKEAERRVRIAQRASWRVASSKEEIAVVEEDASHYEAYFQPAIPSRPQIATLTEKGEDILVARWAMPADERAFSELILWDTPHTASFIFRLPVRSWSNDSAISAAFEKLLSPAKTRGQLPPSYGVSLNVASDPYTHRWIGAGGLLIRYFPRQFDMGYLNWIDLWETATASYLSVTFRMDLDEHPASTSRLIAERFPPLEARIGQWSKLRILDELGSVGSMPRDRVLARELVRRDLTGDELLAALRKREFKENGELLHAVVDARLAPHFVGAIREYLLANPWSNDRSLHPDPFNIVGQAEGVDFTDVALEVIRQGARSDGAFRYAVAHGGIPPDMRR
jgi:hypothetical protein